MEDFSFAHVVNIKLTIDNALLIFFNIGHIARLTVRHIKHNISAIVRFNKLHRVVILHTVLRFFGAFGNYERFYQL